MVRSFNGESIGHWEGDTLVVDTRLRRRSHHWIDQRHSASDELRIIERMRLINNGATLEIEYTLTDPKSWEGEWKSDQAAGDGWTTKTSPKSVPAGSERAHAQHLVQGSNSIAGPGRGAGRRSNEEGTVRSGSGLLACSVPVLAHHSPAAFDRTKQVTLTGTVKEFRWQNPHTWIEVLVPNDKGEEVLWGIELTSPTYLVRAGWKSNTIRPGDKVTVVGNPVRSGEPSAIFVSLTLADGRTLTERPARLGGEHERPGSEAGPCTVRSACDWPGSLRSASLAARCSRRVTLGAAARDPARAAAQAAPPDAPLSALAPSNLAKRRPKPPFDLTGNWFIDTTGNPDAWRFGAPYPASRRLPRSISTPHARRRPRARCTAMISVSAGRPACRSS